jgi:hypothetical protein
MEVVLSGVLAEALFTFRVLRRLLTSCSACEAALASFASKGDLPFFKSLCTAADEDEAAVKSPAASALPSVFKSVEYWLLAEVLFPLAVASLWLTDCNVANADCAPLKSPDERLLCRLSTVCCNCVALLVESTPWLRLATENGPILIIHLAWFSPPLVFPTLIFDFCSAGLSELSAARLKTFKAVLDFFVPRNSFPPF